MKVLKLNDYPVAYLSNDTDPKELLIHILNYYRDKREVIYISLHDENMIIKLKDDNPDLHFSLHDLKEINIKNYTSFIR